MTGYWSKRFAQEGMIWGSEPSPSAEWAKRKFQEAGVSTVLVPGAGYGRHTKVFSADFTVYGIELSGKRWSWAQHGTRELALLQARRWSVSLGSLWMPYTAMMFCIYSSPGTAAG